jgi:predicted nucleotidyltransferase
MPNPIEVVVVLAEVFDRLHFRFAVGGAIANNFWGIVRTTQDVDCLISLPAIQYQVFADELNSIGFELRDQHGQSLSLTVPLLLEQARERKLIECYFKSVRVELFVPAVALQEEVLRRAVRLPLNGNEIPITTAEDLILLKLVFHRVKDLQDIRGILWVQRGRLDLDYLRHWSARTHEPEVRLELDQMITEYSQTKE